MSDDMANQGQRKPDWAQLEHLVRGARQRGFTEVQCEYLTSCIGLAWAKASFDTEERMRERYLGKDHHG